MSGIPHDHYEPKTKGEKWVESRLPVIGLIYDIYCDGGKDCPAG